MPREGWAAAGRTALTGVLAAAMLATGMLASRGTPARAEITKPAAATTPQAPAARASAASAVYVVHTVPAIRGVRVSLDGRTHLTGRDGAVRISTVSGAHRIGILPPRSHAASTTVRFSRWLDGLALSRRTITLSPGLNLDEAGFVVFHPISVRFTDPHGRAVALSDVSKVTIASSLGRRFTFSPHDPPRALPVNRVVRNTSGLVPLTIRYSVRDVIIDGSNVVYGGSQNFFVHPSGAWTVRILLFPLRVEVHDALFGFGIGTAVRLTLPDGSHKVVALGPGHAVTLTGLPRATYQLVAEGPGFGLTSPSTLSKPQVARLLLLSWIDILAAVIFIVLFVIGLPLLGGRIVRGPGRAGLPAWRSRRATRPRLPPQAAAGPAEAETTTLPVVPDTAGNTPEGASAPGGTPGRGKPGGETDARPPAASATADTAEIPAVTGGEASVMDVGRRS